MPLRHGSSEAVLRENVAGRTVWVGTPRFAMEYLVLDEKGHIVRAKKVVSAVREAKGY